MGPMSRWLLALVLAVGMPTTALAQPRPQLTAKAQTGVIGLEKKVAQLETQRQALTKQYAAETAVVDRLKKQRASWRRDRELEKQLATAKDTATKLERLTAEHRTATSQLVAARRQLVAAIDAEIAAGPTPARVAELARLKRQVAPQATKQVARIVLPDLEIDPLADPEELEAQAAAFRQSEQKLLEQVAMLDRHADELDEVARLRKQHDRAGELSRRDDDQPQRSARDGSSRFASEATSADDSAPTTGSPPPQGPDGFGSGGAGSGGAGGTDVRGEPVATVESAASIALSDVVDPQTIEVLHKATRSGDPAQRALATKRMRDAAKRRLEQLQKKRAEIEALAKKPRR